MVCDNFLAHVLNEKLMDTKPQQISLYIGDYFNQGLAEA